jgi:hypothetical protein
VDLATATTTIICTAIFGGESPEKVGILQCCVFQSGALAQRGGLVVLCF